MAMRRLAFVAFVSAGLGFFAACVGSDPDPSTSTNPGDGGLTDTPASTDAGASTDTSSPPVDSGSDASLPCKLVSWWTGDNTYADKLGANNLTGDAGAFASGKFNAALAFDSNYAGTTSPGGLDALTQITIEGWINVSCTRLDRRIVTHDTSATSPGWSLHVGEGDYVQVRIGGTYLKSTEAIVVGTTTHVAATYDGSSVTLYLDGIEKGKLVALDASVAAPSGTELRLGATLSGTSPFCGFIDELAVYGRALSAEEIGSIYLKGPSGRCSN